MPVVTVGLAAVGLRWARLQRDRGAGLVVMVVVLLVVIVTVIMVVVLIVMVVDRGGGRSHRRDTGGGHNRGEGSDLGTRAVPEIVSYSTREGMTRRGHFNVPVVAVRLAAN